jgi:hypothetical protein
VTASRWSRGLYGALKALSFCALGLLLVWPYLRAGWQLGGIARKAVDLLVYATVTFAIVRAVPVLWEGRRYFGAASAKRHEAAPDGDAPDQGVRDGPWRQTGALQENIDLP